MTAVFLLTVFEYSAAIVIGRSALHQPTDTDRARVRRDAITWASAIALDARTIYLDTETTGLDGTAEIIEVAVIDYRGNILMDTFVRPQECIPPGAQAIHGISDAMVAGAPQWPAVYAELIAILARSNVVVYNAEFDFMMANQMNRRHSLPTWPGRWQCAMRQYSEFAGIWHERFGNYRWHKLERALADFGHPPASHRALADASACRLVVHGIAES